MNQNNLFGDLLTSDDPWVGVVTVSSHISPRPSSNIPWPFVPSGQWERRGGLVFGVSHMTLCLFLLPHSPGSSVRWYSHHRGQEERREGWGGGLGVREGELEHDSWCPHPHSLLHPSIPLVPKPLFFVHYYEVSHPSKAFHFHFHSPIPFFSFLPTHLTLVHQVFLLSHSCESTFFLPSSSFPPSSLSICHFSFLWWVRRRGLEGCFCLNPAFEDTSSEPPCRTSPYLFLYTHEVATQGCTPALRAVWQAGASGYVLDLGGEMGGGGDNLLWSDVLDW